MTHMGLSKPPLLTKRQLMIPVRLFCSDKTV